MRCTKPPLSARTIEGRYYLHKHGGFEGLFPDARADKGRSRAIRAEVAEVILRAKREKPRRSVRRIIRMLERAGLVARGELERATVHRVDRTMASTFLDGILPATGFDARSLTTPLAGNAVFHSVTRSGVPELQLGVGFAPMNQARDDTKPTWKLGLELHPGVSNLENYLETSARLAVRARFGPRLSFAAFGQLAFRTDHVISFAEAGVDLPTCPTAAPRCETDDNDVVNPGTAEVNPLHVKRIDLVGHRYRAEDSRGYVLGLEAHLAF